MKRNTGNIPIKIFLATASDAKDLLEIAKKEIKAINDIYPRLNIKILDWGNSAVSSMGNPETEILKQMPIQETDFFIQIFRFKYGEPTGNLNPATKRAFQSGMEEEFFYAYEYWKKNQKPQIMIFKSEENVPRNIALEYKQIVATEEFFKEFRAEGEHPGLYNTYSSVDEFTTKFKKNLLAAIFKILEKDVPDDYERFRKKKDYGLVNVFFDMDNEARNSIKRHEISKTGELKIQAKSCYSFVGRSSLYSSSVHKALKNGMKLRLIMQNPWSLNALYSALNENDFPDKRTYEQYLKHELAAEEIICIYENSHWKKAKFQVSLDGYKELKNKYKAKVDLRILDNDLSDSIFLSDNYLMLEPYFNTAEFEKKAISLFEVQLTKDSDLYKETSEFFETQWKAGYRYKYFIDNEQQFKKRLELYLENSIKEKK